MKRATACALASVLGASGAYAQSYPQLYSAGEGFPPNGVLNGPLSLGSNLLSGSNVALSGGTIDGVALGANTPITHLGLSGSFNAGLWTGASKLPFYVSEFLFGTQPSSPGAGNFNWINISDGVNSTATGSINALGVTDVPGSAAQGNRNVIQAHFQLGTKPASPASYVGVNSWVHASTNDYGTGGSFSLIPSAYNGALWSFWALNYLDPGATNWGGLWGNENDLAIKAGASAASMIGFGAILLTGHRNQGVYIDQAFEAGSQDDAGSPGWRVAYGVGSSTSQWPLNTTNGEVLRTECPTYGHPSSNCTAYRGIDLQQMQAVDSFFVAPNVEIDRNGGIEANGVTTTGSIQAQTATLAGVTIKDGGAYTSVPPLTVASPPSGGTAATATVTSMGLSQDAGNGVFAIVNGGAGCMNGTQILTVQGGTGAPATLNATVVGGVVTSASPASPGSMSVLPTNPATATGGGCATPPAFTLTWGITGVSVAPGSGYPASPAPIVESANVTNYVNASLVAVMNPASAALKLNASGGDVGVGSGAAISPGATSGFFRLPFTTSVPTGTPANTSGPACQWNSTTHTLNCYDGTGWYHISASPGAG
jgi:hypothetical protein